jgi:hypothetical protein
VAREQKEEEEDCALTTIANVIPAVAEEVLPLLLPLEE